MKQFFASTVEQRRTFESDFETHPMECGWATEAIFFITVEEISDEVALKGIVEISADGVHWIPEGTAFERIEKPGRYFVKVTHFGNWLRINGQLEGKGRVKLSVQLHLKE